jgi:hypothetical protein
MSPRAAKQFGNKSYRRDLMKPEIKILREDNDPEALRVSIGGTPEVGYYFVYRGEPQQILAMLEPVIAAATAQLEREQ